MIVINRTVFTHGGLPPLAGTKGLQEINRELGEEFEKFVRLWHELIDAGLLSADMDALDAARHLADSKENLEESITIYERGEKLKAHCDAKLKQAEARIEKITLSADGQPQGTEPLDVD